MSELEKVKEEYEKLKLENEDLKKKVNDTAAEDDAKSVVFTDYESTTGKDSDTDDDSGNGKRRKRRKKKDLKNILKSHQRILKGLAGVLLNKEIADENLTTEINDLSKKDIREAIQRNNLPSVDNIANEPSPPKLREAGEAKIATLREAIQSLKDIFKNSFSGSENDDVLALLKHAGQLAHSGQLSIDQFYVLLKSRISMGTPLYREVTFHYNQLSPPRILYKELIPLYASNKNYIQHLNRMNAYKPGPGDTANTVLAKVKTMAIEMAESSNILDKDKPDYILGRIRDKIITLYPSIAHDLIHKENITRSRTVGDFTRLFLSLGPLVDYSHKKNSRQSVNEVTENDEDLTVFEISQRPTIKLTKAHAERLSNKCYKCASENPDQGNHFGRECIWYKDTPLAYYLCNRCQIGVHLPKYCLQAPDSIQQIEIIEGSDSEDQKN